LRGNFLAVPVLSEELEPEIIVFKFIPVVGRVIESLHRDVKVAAKHFHWHHIPDVWPPSAVYVFFMCFCYIPLQLRLATTSFGSSPCLAAFLSPRDFLAAMLTPEVLGLLFLF